MRRAAPPLLSVAIAAAMTGGLAGARLLHAAPPADAEARAAAARRQVVLIDLPGDAESAALARGLTSVLSREPSIAMVAEPALAAALQGPLTDEDSRALADAARALGEARDQLARFDVGAAVARAELGQRLLLEAAPTVAAIDLLSELALTEGLARFTAGERVTARPAFLLAHRLRPTRTLDPAQYVPEVVQAYAEAVAPSTGTASLEVTGDGTVWIDDREIGPAPTTATVTPGVHLVIAFGPERLPRGQRVEVATGALLSVTLPIAPAPRALQIQRARRALADAPDAAAQAAAVARIATETASSDAILIGRDSAGVLTVQLWRDRAPGLGRSRVVGDRTPAQLIAPLLPPRPVARPEPGPVVPSRPPPRPWWEVRWVQASLVGGALAIVAGAVALSLRGPEMRPVAQDFGPRDVR